MIKTYEYKGLVECLIYINVGGALVPLHFKDGAITANGMITGKFTTSNRAIQEIIENCPIYGKDKKIYVVSKEELAGYNEKEQRIDRSQVI